MIIKSFRQYYDTVSVLETDYAGATCSVNGLRPYNANKLIHYALGLASEALELREARDKAKPLIEQVMELGDICWFSALATVELGHEPNLTTLYKYPTQGLPIVYALIEDFVSSIKSGLAYGSPIRSSHQAPDRWRELPGEIFMRTVAIGNAAADNKCVLTKNIDKLRTRFPERFSAAKAVNRDEVAELHAVASPTEIAELSGTLVQRLHAKNTSGSGKA